MYPFRNVRQGMLDNCELSDETDEENQPVKKIKFNPSEKRYKKLCKIVIGNVSKEAAPTLNLQNDHDKTLDSKVPRKNEHKSAWSDDDDEMEIKTEDNGIVTLSRKEKFKMVYGDQPTWADMDQYSPENDDEILRTSAKMLGKPKFLSKGVLDIKRITSLNSETRTEGQIIKVTEFHPKMNIGLVAGVSGVASLFQLNGLIEHFKLASIKLNKFPIHCGRFSADGHEIVLGSSHYSYFFSYDMLEGVAHRIPINRKMMNHSNFKKFEISPDGCHIAVVGLNEIHLLTSRSKEWICTFPMTSAVSSLAFNSDGSKLYSHGAIGEVCIWDLTRRVLEHRFIDEGCVKGSAISISPCDAYIATGCTSGIVNLYNSSTANSTKNPIPLKTFKNLVTSISRVRFNSTSEILGFCSDEKYNSIKLVHVSSQKAFPNFPYITHKLGRVQDFAFSQSSGYLCCGSNTKTAFLYRLRDFENY